MSKKVEKSVSTPVFKLRAKEGKNYQLINIKNQFGFIPNAIIIERSTVTKNAFIVHAVLYKDTTK